MDLWSLYLDHEANNISWICQVVWLAFTILWCLSELSSEPSSFVWGMSHVGGTHLQPGKLQGSHALSQHPWGMTEVLQIRCTLHVKLTVHRLRQHRTHAGEVKAISRFHQCKRKVLRTSLKGSIGWGYVCRGVYVWLPWCLPEINSVAWFWKLFLVL